MLSLLALSVALAGCASPPADPGNKNPTPPTDNPTDPQNNESEEPQFNVALRTVDANGTGSEDMGYVFFSTHPFFPGKVMVMAVAKGLAPGPHGFHVHAGTSCSPTPATNGTAAVPGGAAGGHFNPTNASHGAHAGDLGNLVAGVDGRAGLVAFTDKLSLDPADPAYIMGRAVVVHRDIDDGVSQPAGNAGPRVLCGVIADETTPDPDGFAGAMLSVATPNGSGEPVGEAMFIQWDNATWAFAYASNLTVGPHGIHVHANGSCDPTPATNTTAAVPAGGAGGHFNPTNATHGQHAGDLGNLVAGADGVGTLTILAPGLSLDPASPNYVGDRSVVVHAKADDGVTDPSGNSGARVLCGIVTSHAE